MDDTDPVQSALAVVRRRFVAMLPEHINSLRAFENAQSPEALTAIRYAVHKIAGTAGTLGYGTLSQLARDVEAVLPSDLSGPTSDGVHNRIAVLLDEALRVVANGPDNLPSSGAAAFAEPPASTRPPRRGLFGSGRPDRLRHFSRSTS